MRALVDEAYEQAKEILTTYKDKLIEISELLIEKETLDAADFEALFEGMPRPRAQVGAATFEDRASHQASSA